MDNPAEDDKTTINVKAVRKSAWEAAKRAAAQEGDSMGTWLSDAIDQRVKRDANQILPPDNPSANPGPHSGHAPMTPEGLATLIQSVGVMAQGLAALAGVRGMPKAEVKRAVGLVDEHVRQARGLGPRPVREAPGKAASKERRIVGQPGMIAAAAQPAVSPAPAEKPPTPR